LGIRYYPAGFLGSNLRTLETEGYPSLEKEGPNEGCWVVPFGGLVETEKGSKVLTRFSFDLTECHLYRKDVAYQLWKFGLLKKDFLYKTWGLQANGEMLWTTAPKGEPADRLPHRFGKADRVIKCDRYPAKLSPAGGD